jgi:hypothetical protein
MIARLGRTTNRKSSAPYRKKRKFFATTTRRNIQFRREIPHNFIHDYMQPCVHSCMSSLMDSFLVKIGRARVCRAPTIAGALPRSLGFSSAQPHTPATRGTSHVTTARITSASICRVQLSRRPSSVLGNHTPGAPCSAGGTWSAVGGPLPHNDTHAANRMPRPAIAC